ncbi:MAG: penicillin-binding protein 1A, partial [Rhizobiaceae bacterium]
GLNSYGIAGAALTYFDKSVSELTIAEAAYLAALPKGPSNYHPFRQTEKALVRRNYVIDEMVQNNYVTPAEAEEAKKLPLGVNLRKSGDYLFASEYFTEEVRREIVSRYGEKSLYEGGLSVRSTIDPKLQIIARETLHRGLIKFDHQQGYRGPYKTIDVSGDWGVPLTEIPELTDLPEWTLAVVLDATEEGITVGLRPGLTEAGTVSEERAKVTIAPEDFKWAYTLRVEDKRVKAETVAEIAKAGDVVFVEKQQAGNWAFHQFPKISGALISMDPHTGRVLAMVGGFSYSHSQFNRATQAMRQPGSSFKPFLYAAALDNGYTPASVVLDAPISVDQGGALGIWEPKNYGGKPAGPSTLRGGLEQSRNLMTVRLAKDMGMKLVAEYAERFGVYDKMLPVLSMSLGSGETTTLKMVTAFSVFANGGRAVKPSMIDRIQDRFGKTIFRHDERGCEGCAAASWQDQEEPELTDGRDQVLDPMTAYQVTSMLQGVIQRGTAAAIKDIGFDAAGKTGTTNEEKDAWFVGYTPDMVTGVYIGFDQPTPMGKGMTGGALAAPIFADYMKKALEDRPHPEFRAPGGMTLVSIDRKTGMRASGKGKNTIIEAFKPGTGPADSYSVIGFEDIATQQKNVKISPAATKVIQDGGGGLF